MKNNIPLFIYSIRIYADSVLHTLEPKGGQIQPDLPTITLIIKSES